jgi:hypothetical protein
MNDQQGKNLLIACWLIVIGVITWDELHKKKETPVPQRYIHASIGFGLLGLAGYLITFQLAGVFGVGLLLALLYQTLKPGEANVNQSQEGD